MKSKPKKEVLRGYSPLADAVPQEDDTGGDYAGDYQDPNRIDPV